MSSPLHFGKYFLVDKIGTGGMAELYLAKQTGLKGFEKVLAIKRILPHLTQDTEFVNMFINEAKLAALLSHQNIVQIFDLGNVDGIYYIAMEYVMGKDLRTVLKKRKERKTRIPTDLAVLVASRVCSGLDYAHRKKDFSGGDLNIVHRDVSPQNILVSYEGEVKIVDFGIAKAASGGSETKAGVLKGKLAYMAPEQAWGKPIDRRTDVFATGIVLYEMLTGERPFKATGDLELLEKVREAGFDPPSKTNPEIYPELEAVVSKAMAKDPAERYQTMSEMELALETLIVNKGYGLSSLNLSQYMAALFKEEMELDTQRFQMATTISPAGTLVERTVRRPTPPKTGTGDTPRVEKTPTPSRPFTPLRQPQPQKRHPAMNLVLWGMLLALTGIPVFIFMKPHTVLNIMHQHAWLSPMESTVRQQMEDLGLIQPQVTAAASTAQTQEQLNSQATTNENTTPAQSPSPPKQQTPSLPEAVGTSPTEGQPPPIQPAELGLQASSRGGSPSSTGPASRIIPEKPTAPSRPPQMKADLMQLFATAKRQYEERDLDSLETTLRKIIEKDPGAVRAYHLLGHLYLERKDEETALRIFAEAVNMFPQDPMLHHELGALYYKRGFHELARQELSKALEIAPNFPKAEQTRNLLLSLKGTRALQPVDPPAPPSTVENLNPPENTQEQAIPGGEENPPPQSQPDTPVEGNEPPPDHPPPPAAGSE